MASTSVMISTCSVGVGWGRQWGLSGVEACRKDSGEDSTRVDRVLLVRRSRIV